MGTKVFPIPSDIRWCVYLDAKNKPTGEVGHICKGFKTGYAVMGLFYVGGEKKVTWHGTKCTHCHEEMPEDIRETLRFIML